MALVVYPSDNFDSFVSLSEANTIIAENVFDTEEWDEIADNKKEVLLRQATDTIKSFINLKGDEDTYKLKKAVALLAEYSIEQSKKETNLKREAVAGVYEKEYYEVSNKNIDNIIPTFIRNLLKDYNLKSFNTIEVARA